MRKRINFGDMLKIIKNRGGTIGLDFSDKNLSKIDLSAKKITEYLNKKYDNNIPIAKLPAWFVEVPKTIFRGRGFWRGEHRDKDNRILSPKEIMSSLRFRLNLRGIIFSRADLSNANLQCADLSDATLAESNFKNAYMWGSVLDNANLSKANLGKSYFVCASFKDAILNNASLECANLSYSDLRNADLEHSNLKSVTSYGADFSGANLRGSNLHEASIWRAELQSAKIDFKNVEAGLIYEDEYAWRSHVDYHWNKDQENAQEGRDRSFKRRYLEAADVYRELRRNFSYNGNYLASSFAYINSRNMERKTHHPKHARNCYGWQELSEDTRVYSPTLWWFYVKHTSRWFLDWIAGMTCGYGEKPLRTLIWAACTLIVFPFLFRFSDGVKSISGKMTWLDYFNYSAASFTTIGFNQYNAISPLAQTLTSIEALIGISLIALLMFTLGNRISRH